MGATLASVAHPERTRRPDVAGRHGLLYPLDQVCGQAGARSPAAHAILSGDIPPSHRPLLDHRGNMTSTLERRFGPLLLRVLDVQYDGLWYSRRVLLVQSSGRPIELAAIRVRTDFLDVPSRRQVLRGDTPFGCVLRAAGIPFASVPHRFLAVTPSAEMLAVFWLGRPRTLYGRQATLVCGQAAVGHVLEVLSPSFEPAGIPEAAP